MPEIPSLLTFALVALGLVLTPGPNMIYLISRSICQGRRAGLVSLGGVALGFVFYMLCAAFGITALILRLRRVAHQRRGLSALSGLAGGEARRALGLCGARPACR